MNAENLTISPISIFQDNYIWCLTRPSQAAMAVVDPGDAAAVIDFATSNAKTLTTILITHHHWDHTDGIAILKQKYPEVRVIGPAYEAARIEGLTELVKDDDSIVLPELELELQVMHVPGHTLGHIAFYQAPWLFCGDTLFSAGCGRLFEGSPEQMHQSLQRLAQLPDDTEIYCTHEYTLANLAFAREVEPTNQAVITAQAECRQRRNNQLPTLPSTLRHEKAINPFLRCQEPELQTKYGTESAEATFAALRSAKDQFIPK